MTGWETLVDKLSNSWIYLDVKRVKRGYYTATMELMEFDPKGTTPYELTERYVRRLEETLAVDPAYWLWSHRRWKHKPMEQQKKTTS